MKMCPECGGLGCGICTTGTGDGRWVFKHEAEKESDMSDVDQKNNELVFAKQDAMNALETAVIEHTNLIRDLHDAQEKVCALKRDVERAECRRSVARTRYEQADMAYTSYREERAVEQVKKTKTPRELEAESQGD